MIKKTIGEINKGLSIEMTSRSSCIKFSCKECNYNTAWKTILKQHIDAIHRNITYSCDKCSFKTKWKRNLKPHINAIHKNIFYFCNQCDYKTTWKSNLTQHSDSRHTNATHNCDQCEYKAKQKRSLKQHMVGRHREVNLLFKQYEQKLQKRNLKNYIISGGETQSKQSTEKNDSNGDDIWQSEKGPRTCFHQQKEATRKIINSMQLWKNTLRNTQYPCNQCNYKASQRVNLRKHTEMTHGTFGCSLCYHKSTRKTDLEWHMVSMHGDIYNMQYYIR